jgi:hypothetical protein
LATLPFRDALPFHLRGDEVDMKSIIRKLNSILNSLKNERNKDTYTSLYKVEEIIEEDEEFTVVIKIKNKNITFNAKPEDILADDSLVDRFSPKDIRALTYLGYLGINRPKYKILAQKLSENETITFLLKKKGERKILVKTAAQITQEANLISSMKPEDAKLIGYTIASESTKHEKQQKAELLKQLYIP